MGFFSWRTCDTEESIPAEAAGVEMRPVYLLQPNGKPPIKEDCYQGYGDFGGINAYNWLISENAEALGISLVEKSEEDIRLMGISLDVGNVLKDPETGKIWHVFHDGRDVVDGEYFAGTYAAVIPELGDSANNLVAEGKLVRVAIKDIVDIVYPLKFSFDPDAVYEDLPASEDCPYQGYFYPWPDEDDDDDEFIIPDDEDDEEDEENL